MLHIEECNGATGTCHTIQRFVNSSCFQTLKDNVPQVKSMAKGRAEVLGLVSRRKYGELMERDLSGRKLQRSVLDVRCVSPKRIHSCIVSI